MQFLILYTVQFINFFFYSHFSFEKFNNDCPSSEREILYLLHFYLLCINKLINIQSDKLIININNFLIFSYYIFFYHLLIIIHNHDCIYLTEHAKSQAPLSEL